MGTESHLDETILSFEIFPNNFFHTGKIEIVMVTVFSFLLNTILSLRIDTNTSTEIIWIHVNVSKNSDIVFGSFYCPPHSSDTILEDLRSSLVYIKLKYPRAQVILGGDFNCPGIDWHHGTLTESYISHHFRQELLSLSHDTQMSQLVTFPKRA